MSNISKKVNISSKPINAINDTPDIDVSLIKLCVMLNALLCIISTVVFDKSKNMNGVNLPIFGLVLIAGITIYLGINKKLSSQNIVFLLFLAGFLLRLNYVLYTPLSETVRVRQHDVYKFGGDVGHAAYIEHFYNNGYTLPDFNPTTKAQFYQPPLNHIIEALWMRILTTFGMSYTRAIGSLMFLPLFYSSCCMIVSERIFSKIGLRGTGKIIPLSIIAFHPTFIILAGSINNDTLSVLFSLLAIYATVVWYKDSTTKNILFIALYIGLGMSTKISVALIALPIASVFLMKLIMEKKNLYQNIGQYCVFGCVCLPLGLWFPLRNLIKYKISLTYVPRLSDTSDQYVGFRSAFERLFGFEDNPFNNVFLNKVANGDDYFEYNPFVSLIKTSLFGEYNYSLTNEGITPFCRILLILNIILIIVSVAAFIYCSVKKSDFLDTSTKVLFGFCQIILFVSFVQFSLKYPHTCSMDFRYILPTLVVGAMFIGIAYEQIKLTFGSKKTLINIIKYSISGLTAVFCLFSALVYIILGKG